MAKLIFPTSRKESPKTRFFRWGMNVYPMYLGTGGKVLFIAADWREVQVRLRLGLRTRNYVGTIFGGSLFAASDPFYMLMLFHILGREYVVWDKAASIRFKRPGRTTLYSHYILTDSVMDDIRQRVGFHGETEQQFVIQWKDASGNVYCEIERTCYIANKSFYEARKGHREKAVSRD